MKLKRGAVELNGVLVLCGLVLVCIAGFMYYRSQARKKAMAEQYALQVAREEREQREKEARERRIREEEEFERQKREARLAREKEEEQREAAERERRRLAVEAEAELQKKKAEMRKWKEVFTDGLRSFSKVFMLAKDVPANEKPKTVASKQSFWCAFASYPEEKRIYKIEAEPGGRMTVFSHTGESEPVIVDEEQFMARLKTERSATVTGQGKLFITGVKPPSESAFAVPERGTDFRIVERNLKDFYSAFVALGISAPNHRYKVVLRSSNGKTNVSLGEFGYDETVSRSRMENAIRAKLGRQAADASVTESKVKKPKFKRSAVLYDGKHIKQQLGGPTLVPRVYEYVGTTRYKMDNYRTEAEFRRKWEALRRQAEMEDKREQEIEAEYKAALEQERIANERRISDAKRASDSIEAVETELSKCKIYVVQLVRRR